MNWKCPVCSSENNSTDALRCSCGYEMFVVKKATKHNYWSECFFAVDSRGRSFFRTLLAGLFLVSLRVIVEACGLLSTTSISKGIVKLGMLGKFFIFWSLIGPTVSVLFGFKGQKVRPNKLANYIDNARLRATRRKSAWNLLLIPAVTIPLGAIWLGIFKIMGLLHSHVYPEQNLHAASKGLGAVLAAVAPAFGAIPIAFLIGNCLVWLVPPARRGLDTEAQQFPSTSFVNAQKQLLKFAYIVVPISLALSVIGALLPWYV